MGIFDFFKRNKNKEVEEEIQEQIEEETQEQIEEEAQGQIEEETQEQIEEEVQEQIEEETQKQIEEETQGQIEEEAQEQIEEEAQEQIEEETQKQIEEETQGQIEEEAQGQIEEETQKQIEEDIQEDNDKEIKGFFGKIFLGNDKVETNITEAEVNEELEEEINQEHEEPQEPLSSEYTDTEEKGFFKKIFSGLDKTRKNIMDGVESVLKGFTVIDDDLFEELEEILIMADIGVETSTLIIDLVKDRVKKEKVTEVYDIKKIIAEEITKILTENETELTFKKPTVILVIGVNGVGKTTTIGKLSNNFKSQGKKVVLAAADTFRAAAIDQLEIWGKRNEVDVIKHQENSDPGAVVYDAIKAAKSRQADVLICDTAGRLHNKKNLMEELKKIFKIINREYEEAQLEVFLVLDSTTGQNALQQAKLFKEVANITGLVLTKLDGTAKGGIIIAIKNELKIPVRYIGVGEGINDLQPFNAEEFALALFNMEENKNE